MRNSYYLALLLMLCIPALVHTQNKTADKISFRAYPFELNEVQLLDSPFKRAMELDVEVLLKINPDRLLHNFRVNAGLKPKGELYGGWEKMGIAGHSLGHYLTALSLHYGSTGDRRFLDRVNYIVNELDECQKAGGDGFLGGMPVGR